MEENVLHICGYDVTYTEFKKLCNFVNTDQNATKLCTKLFFYKIKKNIP